MLCPVTGKRQYRSFYSADRRLKKEKAKYLNKGGWVYRCQYCDKWHLTYHTYSDKHHKSKYKRSSKNNVKRLSERGTGSTGELLEEEV